MRYPFHYRNSYEMGPSIIRIFGSDNEKASMPVVQLLLVCGLAAQVRGQWPQKAFSVKPTGGGLSRSRPALRWGT